ncbi:hypothetical protein [Pedobacter sp. N23S346]|uniref:hypothetical protein n=1 Tax=Pedobacter sp. N23S346 TaxID=3402750 RepID=UPI003AD0932D
MKYLEWNNLISSYLFNTQKAGIEIYLYVSKNDILNLARPYFNEETEEEIWDNFIRKIKNSIPGSQNYPDIISKATHLYEKWQVPGLKSIDGVEIIYPPYIGYLIFLVLPLIEIQGNYNSNNYYDRLAEFLNLNGITQNLRNRLIEIEPLWKDLIEWANNINNGEFGYFYLRTFSHQNWIYVGKVFSQCAFPPKAIKKLPILFQQASMVPDSNYSFSEFKKNLLQYSAQSLGLTNNVLDIIRKSDTNELGQSIIELVKKEYNKWSGQSLLLDALGTELHSQSGDIVSRLYLQFKLSINEGRMDLSYRMRSSNEFPEDLCFDGKNVVEEKFGYSRTLEVNYSNTLTLKDKFNRWVAKFEDRDIRLFRSAGAMQFSSDYWLETDTLSKSDWMYILCKDAKKELISNWVKNDCARFQDETDEYDNIPVGYSLYKFLNPQKGIDSVGLLTIIKEKSIKLISALQVDFRTFTDDFLPEVEIINADGTESISLVYKNGEEITYLKKKLSAGNIWLLPENISLYCDFSIKSDNETFAGYEATFKIVSSHDTALSLKYENLPIRDFYGKIGNLQITETSRGINVTSPNLLRQIPYTQLYKGNIEDFDIGKVTPVYDHSQGNILITYLSLKQTLTAPDYYSAFDTIYTKFFDEISGDSNNKYSRVKKSSLNFYNNLGYLDYDYENKSIVVHPPQFIYIPSEKGRKILLTGGRDASLLNKIIEHATKYELEVEFTRQHFSNHNLLLPDALTIKSFGNGKDKYGEERLIAFANDIGITFNPNDLIQISLQLLCSNTTGYEEEILSKNTSSLTFEDWPRYIFNPQNLKMEQSVTDFDKACTLIEYRLRPWEFHYRLWFNGVCYDVDSNWGKYLILKHKKRDVILYDASKRKVAVPLGVPLPGLLSRSIMLLSGLAPVYSYINNMSYRVYENIDSVFIKNLFNKLSQKTIDHNL